MEPSTVEAAFAQRGAKESQGKALGSARYSPTLRWAHTLEDVLRNPSPSPPLSFPDSHPLLALSLSVLFPLPGSRETIS